MHPYPFSFGFQVYTHLQREEGAMRNHALVPGHRLPEPEPNTPATPALRLVHSLPPPEPYRPVKGASPPSYGAAGMLPPELFLYGQA